jgi:hypothetical protein
MMKFCGVLGESLTPANAKLTIRLLFPLVSFSREVPMRHVTAGFLTIGLLVGFSATVVAQDADEPEAKYSIKDVMKQAHGAKLLNKVVAGDASKEEKDKLLDLYLSMLENKPPKGEQQEWIMTSGRLMWAAAAVAVGREGAEGMLKEASNCKACHSAHK